MLSLPPAFVLSQDQTLILIDNRLSCLYITHKEFLSRFLYRLYTIFSSMPPVYPLSYLLCFITPTSSLHQLPVGETAYRLSFIHCQHLFLYFFTFFTLFSILLFLATLFCSLFYTPILIYILCPVIKPNLYCILLHILHSLTLFVNFYLASSKYLSIINVVYINFL